MSHIDAVEFEAQWQHESCVTLVKITNGWPEHIGINPEFLERADPRYVSAGDGMVRLTDDTGNTALYGYAHDQASGPHYDLISAGEPTKEGKE